jgi:EmrB/QacA subfamily drug resistance transporter
MTTPSTRKGAILALCCMAQFMVVLDIAIVNVALPSIQTDLGLRQSTLQWVVIAYGMLLGGFLLLGGRLGDLLGRRRVFLAGAILFSAASLIAGLANSAEILIGARAVQGFAAALLAPSALSILGVTFTEGQERNKALGIFGAIGGSTASVGVIASGLLTDGPGWRWIFFINIPVGILLAILAARFLPADQVTTEGRHYDAAGAVTVTGGLVLLVYGLNRGVDDGWGAASTLALFAISAILLGTFVWVESRSKSPLVPFASLRNRTMVASDLTGFFLFGGFFSFIFLCTLLMQQGLSYSPTRTGFAWLATSLTAFVAAAFSGAKLASSVGVRRLLIVGPLLLAAGCAYLTQVEPGANYIRDLLPAFLLAGFAVGLAAPSVQIGALSGVAGPSVGLASGLVETMREIGGAVGIAAVSTVLVSQSNNANGIADPVAHQAAIFDGFQSAFIVIVVLASLGAFVAAIAFPRTAHVEVVESSTEEMVLAEATVPSWE